MEVGLLYQKADQVLMDELHTVRVSVTNITKTVLKISFNIEKHKFQTTPGFLQVTAKTRMQSCFYVQLKRSLVWLETVMFSR